VNLGLCLRGVASQIGSFGHCSCPAMGTNTGLDLDFVEIVIHDDGRAAGCGEDDTSTPMQNPGAAAVGAGSADGRMEANSIAADTASGTPALEALPLPVAHGQSSDSTWKSSDHRYEEFEVEVQRQKHGLGLDVDKVDGKTMLVTKVKDGPIKDWNDLRKGVGVKLGDRIVSINGVRDDVEVMLQELAKNQKFILQIVRVTELRIEIAKTEKLGIDVDHASGSYLLITRIKEGPVSAYNENMPHDLRLYPGDRIMEVNKVVGDGGNVLVMLERIRTDGVLNFLVRRPSLHVDDDLAVEGQE